MKEKKLTKIGDYEIKRYYQKEDFFIDIEYHDEKNKVIVYVGDKTDLNFGSVMKLASFQGHPYDMKSIPLLDSIEKILDNGLYEYSFFKRFHFKSELEQIKDEEEFQEELQYFPDEDDYYHYEYYGDWDYEIQKELDEKLSVERYKYGKYFFDCVIHESSADDSAFMEIYMFKKGHPFKLLCDKMNLNTIDDGLEKILSCRLHKYILAYKNPWEIKLIEPRFLS